VKLRTSTFVALGVLVALLLAGVLSLYASGSPDGLEKVAADQGFGSAAQDHRLADSPFAGYGTEGVAGERLSGGLAGVVGVGATLLAGGGLFLLIRRRGTGSGEPTRSEAPAGTPDGAPDGTTDAVAEPASPPRG
jgi:hypothetical protein